ncbi:SPOR domain-containing protein [Legionella sp. PATHC038]|uniref:SPOR domain-containing protein n=1 Tax=Legionella sheltonii TaxID=2992041 RepID=UPI002242E928|nr:SPOR domain-containing protein [Legionella sp. PATHC038]MCW8400241.1 SPOR domain-containing protein [Legionella sp. PATHC038]
MNSLNLKWSAFLIASALVGMPISVNAHVIYGLENCSHFNTRQSGPFFVQVSSFHSKHLAQQLKNKLTKHTHHSVQIHASKGYYAVRIGPLSSIAEVHSMCHSLSSGSTIHHALKKQYATHLPKTTHRILKPSKVEPMHTTNASPTSAVSIPSGVSPTMHHWYVGMDVGFMQTIMGHDEMTVANGSNFPPPEDRDQYSLDRHQPVMLDVQAGHRWNRSEQWIPSYALALRYEHVFTKNIHGMVTQYSDPEFTNYSYSWGIEADVISVYSKLDLVRIGRFMPYVDLGLGVSFNRSHNYNESALPDVTPRYSPDYASKRTNHFTYNLGAGLDYLLTQNLLLSAGYSYQSFGNVSSGFGQGPDWNNAQLDLGTFKTNIGLIGVSYLFDNSIPTNPAGFK